MYLFERLGLPSPTKEEARTLGKAILVIYEMGRKDGYGEVKERICEKLEDPNDWCCAEHCEYDDCDECISLLRKVVREVE